jgi:DNA-binding CsgD family transcriptional regulator
MSNVQGHVSARREDGVDQLTLSRLLTAVMDQMECGVMTCRSDGDLLHANLAAYRELDHAHFLRLDDGHVRCPLAARDAWVNALQDTALRQRSSLVSLEDGGERLMVALMPMRVDGVEAPAAVAMMGRRSVCSALGLELLASSHGLTFAERRVLRALVDNSTAREIAESHGVAVATVRTQIQAVRDKLGVRSIDALLLRAAEVPPVTARF